MAFVGKFEVVDATALRIPASSARMDRSVRRMGEGPSSAKKNHCVLSIDDSSSHHRPSLVVRVKIAVDLSDTEGVIRRFQLGSGSQTAS